MWMDVVDLRDFYMSPLGQSARQVVRRQLRQIWPDLRGQRLLGLGYATPYLSAFRPDAERVIAAMPAQQGIIKWPLESANKAALVDELALPFPDVSMDRVLLVHALECAEQLSPMLREVWRVLADNGRVLIVAPNRSGLWARFERTPFGHGRPYSPGQLSKALRDNLFTPVETRQMLIMPPFQTRLFVSFAAVWERMGAPVLGSFAGVVVMEAVKRLYAGTTVTSPARRGYLPLPARTPLSRKALKDPSERRLRDVQARSLRLSK